MLGKFAETYRQPVPTLTAVEETHAAGYSTLPAELAKTSRQPAPTRINVVEPDYVPGLDLGTVTSRFYGQDQLETATPRKEFGTQTGAYVTWSLCYSSPVTECCAGVLERRINRIPLGSVGLNAQNDWLDIRRPSSFRASHFPPFVYYFIISLL